jgi:hypothetical protein
MYPETALRDYVWNRISQHDLCPLDGVCIFILSTVSTYFVLDAMLRFQIDQAIAPP